MKTNGRQLSSGFTLIELVIVITIIAILSAVAFSRYIDIQIQARIAKAQALYGAVRTAANLAKAECMLDVAGVSPSPTCTATGGTANMTGVLVTMQNEYPTADTTGIIAATQINPATDGVIITAGSTTSPLTIEIVGAATPANCAISYTAAVTPGSTPNITLVTSDC